MDRTRFKTLPDEPSHEEAWANWLSDDPAPPTAYTQRPAARPTLLNTEVSQTITAANRPSTAPPPADITVEIHLPKLPIVQAASSFLKQASHALQMTGQGIRQLRTRRMLWVTGALVLVGAVFACWHGLQSSSGTRQPAAPISSAVSASAVAADVTSTSEEMAPTTYKPLVPQTAPQLANGKRGVTAYDKSRNSFNFQDTLEGGEVRVSEQPLPSAADAPTTIAKAAAALKATQTIQTNYGKTYILNDAKANSQTIIFGNSRVLVFVQSPFNHKVSTWQTYVNSLK